MNLVSILLLWIGSVMIVIAIGVMNPTFPKDSPKFTISEMRNCKDNICDAMVIKDDIGIVVKMNRTIFNVGDTIYLAK